MTISKKLALNVLSCTLATLAALPASAFADCENEAASNAKLVQLQTELASSKQKLNDAMQEVPRALDAKAQQLHWDAKQRADFIAGVLKKDQYLAYDRTKKSVVARLRLVQGEFDSTRGQKDPVAACKAGVKLGPLVHDMEEVSVKQLGFIKAEIEAAN